MSQIEWAIDLPDPRVDRSKKHKLESIVVIVAAGAAAGMTSYAAIAEMASREANNLKEHIDLEAGCPSSVTLWRNFERINSEGLKNFINNHKQSIIHIMNSLRLNRNACKARTIKENKTPNLSIINSLIDEEYTNLCYNRSGGEDKVSATKQLGRAIKETVKLTEDVICIAAKNNTTQTCKQVVEQKKGLPGADKQA